MPTAIKLTAIGPSCNPVIQDPLTPSMLMIFRGNLRMKKVAEKLPDVVRSAESLDGVFEGQPATKPRRFSTTVPIKKGMNIRRYMGKGLVSQVK